MERVFFLGLCFTVLAFVSPSAFFGQTTEPPSKGDAQEAILKAIRNGNVEAAGKLLDYYLETSPHDYELWLLRRAMASGYTRLGNHVAADDQLKKLVNYIADHPTESRRLLKHVPQVLFSISDVQQFREPSTSKLLDPLIGLMKSAVVESPSNASYSNGLSSLTHLKAKTLVKQNLQQQAIQRLEQDLNRLRFRLANAPDNPDSWLRLAYNLKTARQTIGQGFEEKTAPWRWERTNLLNHAVRATPTILIAEELVADRLELLQDYESTLPQVASFFYRDLLTFIRKFRAGFPKSRSLLNLQVNIERRFQNFTRVQSRANLIGQQAPVLENVVWLRARPNGHANETENKQILFFVDEYNFEFQRLEPKILDAAIKPPSVSVLLPEVGKSYRWLNSFTKINTVSEANREKVMKRVNQNFVEKTASAIGMLSDPVSTADRFGMTEFPFAVIISHNGTVEAVMSGNGIDDAICTQLSK